MGLPVPFEIYLRASALWLGIKWAAVMGTRWPGPAWVGFPGGEGRAPSAQKES